MASRQSRAGQLIQPADPWICTQNSKSHSSCKLFDLGFVVGMPGGGVYEQRGVSKLQKYHYSEPGIEFSTIKLARISL